MVTRKICGWEQFQIHKIYYTFKILSSTTLKSFDLYVLLTSSIDFSTIFICWQPGILIQTYFMIGVFRLKPKHKAHSWWFWNFYPYVYLSRNVYQIFIFSDCIGGSAVKNLPANAADPSLISASGRYPGEGNGNPCRILACENPMSREAWWATIHRVTKELDMT